MTVLASKKDLHDHACRGWGIADARETGQNFPRLPLEGIMAKPNLSRMDFESLMDLREQVNELLLKRRAHLETQLERIGSLTDRAGRSKRLGGGSALRGRKVPPKYRNPSGDTWAGRGARPRWLVDAIKEGKKLDDFLIEKRGRKRRAKR
jgi:DNA-binding protein H-NS